MINNIIDFHTHTFPDDIAAKGIASLKESYQMIPQTDGTISGLVGSMDRAGIAYSVSQPVATKPSQVRTINKLSATNMESRVICFGAIHINCEDLAGEVENAISLGLKGIKIQCNWQGFAADDPRMYTAYEAASGKLVIMYHAGTEIAPIDRGYATSERIGNVKKLFPKLDLVAAHMGGFRTWEQSWEFLVGSKVFLDTSAALGLGMEPDEFVKMVRTHGADRILFATDNPLTDQLSQLDMVRNSGLNNSELEMILWSNSAELLGIHK